MVVALDRHIESSQSVRGGKPRLAGTRITVGDIVLMHLRMGQSLEQIAARYQVSLAALHAAMAFYYDHREEVDHAIDADEAYIAASKQQGLSKLRDKLEALNRG